MRGAIMKKAISLCLIISMLTISLCGCNVYFYDPAPAENDSNLESNSSNESESIIENKPPLETYKAFVFELGEYDKVKYNEPTEQYQFLPRMKPDKYNMPDITLMLGSDEISMKYDGTYNVGYSDNIIDQYRYNLKIATRVSYHEDDGSFYSLTPGDYNLSISDRTITDEIYLFEICDAYVSNYVKDLTRYKVSIGTRIISKPSHSYAYSVVEGFALAPSDDAEMTYSAIYTVEYNFYVNGIKTEDRIAISVTEDGCLYSIVINMTEKFNKYSDYDIDMELCDQLIESEMSHICNGDGYVLEGYDVEKLLAIINGQLCLIATVTPDITIPDKEANNLPPHVHPTRLLIAVSEPS